MDTATIKRIEELEERAARLCTCAPNDPWAHKELMRIRRGIKFLSKTPERQRALEEERRRLVRWWKGLAEGDVIIIGKTPNTIITKTRKSVLVTCEEYGTRRFSRLALTGLGDFAFNKYDGGGSNGKEE